VEQSAVEEAADAVEELGRHHGSADSLLLRCDDDDDVEASQSFEENEHATTPLAFTSPVAAPVHNGSFALSPISTQGLTPFISPVASATSVANATSTAAATPSFVVHCASQDSTLQQVQHRFGGRLSSAGSTPMSLAPAAVARSASAARGTRSTIMAPSEQEWSFPVELTSATARAERRIHSRYDQRHAAAEQQRRAAALVMPNNNGSRSAVPTPDALSLPLPKISPPTLEQWQRERKAATTATLPNAKVMQSSLALLKRKAAAKRSAAPPGTATATAAATHSAAASSCPARPATAPVHQRSRSRSRGAVGRSTSSLSRSSSRNGRAPLAATAVPTTASAAAADLDNNPWVSDRERQLEQLQRQAAAQFSTPTKRRLVPASTIAHTAANGLPTVVDATAAAAAIGDAGATASVPNATPDVFPLGAPLAPPSHPVQSYRALVNGLHVLPPALQHGISAHLPAAPPDAIRANLRYLTTAYACAELC
jgi:hypothetical protein